MNGTPTRPGLVVSTDGRGVASHGGSRLLADLAEVSGLTGAYSQVLAGLRERRAGHDPGRVLVDLAVMLADGGEAISDLAVLRGQAEVFGGVASTATAWRVVDRVEETLLAGCGRRVRPRGSGRGWPAPSLAGSCPTRPPGAGGGRLVLDVDATQVEAHSEKEFAAATFKGGFGYHPVRREALSIRAEVKDHRRRLVAAGR